MKDKEINLDALPKHNGVCNKINWNLSVGYVVKFKYNNIYGELKILSHHKTKLLIEYQNKTYAINTTRFQRCQLGSILGVKTLEYKYKINQIVKVNTGKIKILNISRVLHIKNWTKKGYTYKCLTCNHIDTHSEEDIKKGYGCPVCAGQLLKVGINDMWTTNHNQASLLLNSEDGYRYMQSSGYSVDWLCPCGNIIRNKSINEVNRNGLACHKCSDGISYPNKFILHLLEQLKIISEGEVNFEWSKNYLYDRVVESKKLIIEMDGKFHKIDNYLSGQTKETSSLIDEEKDYFALNNGYKILRIDCCYETVVERFRYIKKSIICSELPKVLNFSEKDVAWDIIDQLCQKSFIKEACNLWLEVKNTRQISDMLGLSIPTIITYLKLGTKHGWCDYDSEESRRRSVICIDNSTVYLSLKETYEDTGISRTSIGNCCNGLSETAGGYHWMYYEDYLKLHNETNEVEINT